MKKLLGIFLAFWLHIAQAAPPVTMKQYLPALAVIVANNGAVRPSDPPDKQRDEAYVLGVFDGVYASILRFKKRDHGSFLLPKDGNVMTVLKDVQAFAAASPDSGNWSPGDFIYKAMYEMYASREFKVTNDKN